VGSGGNEYGIALYEEQGALEKLVHLHKRARKKQTAQMKCIAVTFGPAPGWQTVADGALS
jgi:hypothetical protein